MLYTKITFKNIKQFLFQRPISIPLDPIFNDQIKTRVFIFFKYQMSLDNQTGFNYSLITNSTLIISIFNLK